MNNNYERDDLLGKNPNSKRVRKTGFEGKTINRSSQENVDDLYILKGDSL